MAKARRRLVYRKKSQNRFSMVLAITVMLVILAAELEQQIAEEEQRTKDIEEYSKYTKTDEYVEEVARDKLGLVKQGEIIFKNTGKASGN